ncbi:MAG: glucosylceramidase [Prevotellaceae bacterium]|jgi:glucosylceramidase|nr:glucosylceramidase [Prevotellaceae bacterium]
MNFKLLLVTGILAFSAAACKDNSTAGNGNGNGTTEQPQGDVSIYVTTTSRSSDLKLTKIDFSDQPFTLATTVKLKQSEKFQTIDGFGAAVTGSTCFNLLKMTAADRAAFLKQTYSDTEGFGISYIRISIGCSDFSLSEYTCWDNREAGFALTNEETQYVIPVLKEILAINPNIKVIGSPWTCPRWMKVNNLNDLQPYNSWTSGQLNPAYYAEYGEYFVEWIRAFEAQGIKIYAVTPQNEPLNRGNSASLFMGWQEQRDFLNNGLVPKIKAAGLTAKIYLFDHNYNYDNMGDQNDYPVKIYNSGVDAEVVVGAAYHNYGGNRSELNDIHSQAPTKELIFSEASIGTWNDGRDLEKSLLRDMEELGLGTVINWCKAVIVWNLMLDNDRAPNREGGCTICYGAVDIDNTNYKTITRNSHYYIIAHLASVVKPNATRIGVSGFQPAGVIMSAFENADGTYALVLLNKNESNQDLTIDDGVHHFSYTLPAKAVVSMKW